MGVASTLSQAKKMHGLRESLYSVNAKDVKGVVKVDRDLDHTCISETSKTALASINISRFD